MDVHWTVHGTKGQDRQWDLRCRDGVDFGTLWTKRFSCRIRDFESKLGQHSFSRSIKPSKMISP